MWKIQGHDIYLKFALKAPYSVTMPGLAGSAWVSQQMVGLVDPI